jgi:ferredoxin
MIAYDRPRGWWVDSDDEEALNSIGGAARPRRAWLQPSTRAFLDAARETDGYSWFDLAHGYFYARWPYLYIAVGTGEHWLARLLGPVLSVAAKAWAFVGHDRGSGRGVADAYHGKVVTLAGARQLISVREDIRLPDLEPIVPYPMARDIILKNPDHIVALECPCRSARKDPCRPIDVCLIVGEPFASFVVEHHPTRSRAISVTQASDLLEAEHARRHVHHAFFKDAMLGRFYAICNCCPCCCGAMQAHRSGTPMLASSGYVSEVDVAVCSGCGDCAQECPFDAMTLLDGQAHVNTEACMGCGVCVDVCVMQALDLVRDPSRGEPLEVRSLLEAAAQPATSENWAGGAGWRR